MLFASRFALPALLISLSLAASPCLAAQAAKKPEPEKAPAASSADPATQNAQRSISAETLFGAVLMNAENGQPQAMLTLGNLYEQGIGIPRNFTKAFDWYKKAADSGVAEGWMRLGACYEIGIGERADTAKSVAAYEKAASLGFAPAQHKMAELYLNGRGVAKNTSKGYEFLSKAAEAGEIAAMYDLGQVLRSGLYGRKAEPDKARQWFAKAADKGHAASILSLASMLKEGQGGKADSETALRWYLIAQKAGMSGESLDKVIKELQGKLSSKQRAEADKAAEAWVKARREALQKKGQKD